MKSKMIFGEKTHIGVCNDPSFQINKDSTFINSSKGIFIMADGYGGKDNWALEERIPAKFASELAANYVGRQIEEELGDFERPDLWGVLEDYIVEADKEIDKSCREKNNVKAGTTLDVLLLGDGVFQVAHVGDSSVYILKKDSSFEKITTDDNEAQKLVDSGEITKLEAKIHPKGYILTQSIGSENGFSLAYIVMSLSDVDKILMATDGLTDTLTDEDMREILMKYDPQEAADELVRRANYETSKEIVKLYFEKDYSKKGKISEAEAKKEIAGKDNITAIIIQPNYEGKPKTIDVQKAQPEEVDPTERALSDLELEELLGDVEIEPAFEPQPVAEKLNLIEETDLSSKLYGIVLYESGIRSYKRGDYDVSESIMKRITSNDLSNSEAICYRADSFRRGGNLNGAGKEYISCLRLNPENSDAYNGLGSVHLSRGNTKAAMASWKSAAELGNLFAMHNLLHFEEYQNEMTTEEKTELNEANKRFEKESVDDLGFVRFYESIRSLLKHPYTLFGTSTVENTESILVQQHRLHCYVSRNNLTGENISLKIAEIDRQIADRKSRDEKVISDFIPYKEVSKNKEMHAKSGAKNIEEMKEHYQNMALCWGL